MKAFKGCTNPDCKAYKKIHYKSDDQFCLKCGGELRFVCAECWKPMEIDKERYCISCAAEKEQKKAQAMDKAKMVGGGAAAAIGAVAGVVSQMGNNANKIANGTKKVVDAGAQIVKLVKK